MSVKKLLCATLDSNEAKEVLVESAYIRALPGFSIVGMANQSIQESKERIKSSLTSLGFKYPAQKITINLSPSDIKKEGSHFDLSMALLIYLQKEDTNFQDFFVFGELGLDGSVKDTLLIFPILLSLASKHEKLKVIIPLESLEKASQIPNIECYAIKNLSEAIEFFQGNKDIQKSIKKFEEKSLNIKSKDYYFQTIYPIDYKEVKDQNRLKRTMIIAATGMHNFLLEGSPGCGKSMSIKRLRYILPPLSIEEILQSNAYSSLSGQDLSLEAIRSYRSPHHTSSKPSIFGGGSSKAMAGECALAHNGILFFDEFPHFSKSVLESLREPLEDNQVLISRVNSKIKYETKFLFAAAQNPCPCGNLLSSTKECRCSELEIKRYKNRISEPILDRIDIYFQVSENDAEEREELDSKTMHEKVIKAFIFMKNREQKEFNAKLSEEDIEKYCVLVDEAQVILEKAIQNYGLSYRSVAKVKKIARTIADLDAKEKIEATHLLEALSYRQR